MAVYTNIEEYQEAKEREFVSAVKYVQQMCYYQGDNERSTIDGEWEESELKGNLDDLAMDVVGQWLKYNEHRAIYDKGILEPERLVSEYLTDNDLIEIYNKEYDTHKDDAEQIFTIHHFDSKVKKDLEKMLNDNLVASGNRPRAQTKRSSRTKIFDSDAIELDADDLEDLKLLAEEALAGYLNSK